MKTDENSTPRLAEAGVAVGDVASRRALVAVVATRPETVLEDIDRAMTLAGSPSTWTQVCPPCSRLTSPGNTGILPAPLLPGNWKG